jgi:hypothetical protein
MSNIVNGLAILFKPVNKVLMLHPHGYGLSSFLPTRVVHGRARGTPNGYAKEQGTPRKGAASRGEKGKRHN